MRLRSVIYLKCVVGSDEALKELNVLYGVTIILREVELEVSKNTL